MNNLFRNSLNFFFFNLGKKKLIDTLIFYEMPMRHFKSNFNNINTPLITYVIKNRWHGVEVAQIGGDLQLAGFSAAGMGSPVDKGLRVQCGGATSLGQGFVICILMQLQFCKRCQSEKKFEYDLN